MPIGNGGIIGPANVPTLTTASGVWSLREQQQAQGRGAWPLALIPDPYFEYTTLLLPGNGTNGANNNTFLDGSTNNFTITRNGNTTQGTFSPFSQTGWGNYFTGSGSTYLSIASSADLQLTNSTVFTIEAFIYWTGTTGTQQGIISKRGSSATQEWGLVINSTGKLVFTNTTTDYIGGTTLNKNQWNHIAVSSDGTNIAVYLNGSRDSTPTAATGIVSSTNDVLIGYQTTTANPYTGYISNLRVVKGTQLYSGTSYTVPTATLTAVTNTSLLTCLSNRFVDTNTQTTAKTITVSGSPSVVAFSPFNPGLPWSAATNGGSGYFDGNGDYLQTPNNAAFNLSSGSFTIEAWVYRTNPTTSDYVFWSGTATGSNSGLNFYISGGNLLYIDNGVTGTTGYGSVTGNQWIHVALIRDGGNSYLYVNGVCANPSTPVTQAIGTGGIGLIGCAGVTTQGNFDGYISNFRIIKGQALVTGGANFTPPTGPVNATQVGWNGSTTALTGTCSLLLNYTNAGIYDATSKNDLETLDNTVNGVRISTAQSQFGGSSIYFDGTGTDYLWIQADQPFQRFGTAPFTIELWIRLAATGSARGLVAKGTSTTGWLVSLNTSNQVVFTYGTSTITSTGTISANNWTYIAVVREGTGANQTKIYIGGVNDGTGTVSTDFTQTSSMYIGADRTGGSLFSGYIQDVRITNGYARTVTTIPATAFPTF